jgi:hypothetical protein
MDNFSISKKDLQKLGFGAYTKAGEDIGFTDLQKTAVFNLKNAFLDLENVGPLRKTNPHLVIRKQVESTVENNAQVKVLKSWRQAILSEHFLARYRINTPLVGQLSEAHFPLEYYSYKDNNFFKPWAEEKVVKRIYNKNSFPYARFRFPEKAANTLDIQIQTSSGAQELSPKFVGKLSKEESRKAYYRWYKQATQFQSGQQQSPYDNMNLSGFNIPYPNAVSVYDSPVFNVPVKLAPKFNQDNSQSINGLLLISTGDAEQKTICYVSPHTIETGFLNTVEDLYTENQTLLKSIIPGSENLATIQQSSWHGSGTTGFIGCGKYGYLDTINGTYKQATIPSQDTSRLRFYNIENPRRQIYFDSTISTPYGSGAWAICLSGSTGISINTGQRGVIYRHQPNSLTDWKKTDPRRLDGVWVPASGHPRAASGVNLNRASVKAPTLSVFKSCRKDKKMLSKLLQMPSLIPDSRYLDGGMVLPEGIYKTDYTYQVPAYSTWRAITTGMETQLPAPTGNQWSGYIISGKSITYQTILASGIQIPTRTVTGTKYTIDTNGHFKQTSPLKDTYFYKFYNHLYRDNSKTIATGTWNGIVPSGVKFSVELVSCTLNAEIGIVNDRNISVIYSGYGTLDSIDKVLQTGISPDGAHTIFPNPSAQYIVSGEVPWHQKRNPYRHTIDDYKNLVYTAYKSGPTENDARNIAKRAAVKQINSKILQLVNKIYPSQYNYNNDTASGGLTYKNKKWRRLQKFKQKITWLKSGEFSHVNIPQSAEPSQQIRKRLRPYATGAA